jgi:hypothetical protein
MAFNISEFQSRINDAGGLTRTNRFRVEIGIPKIMNSLDGTSINLQVKNPALFNQLNSTQKYLEYFCEAAHIPGVALNTHEYRRYGYGSIEKRPFAATFTDITLTFLFDNKRKNYDFFQYWLNSINNYDYRSGISGESSNKITGLNLFELEYKDNYSTEVRIFLLDDTGNTVASYVMTEAFPIFVGDIPLSWNDTNGVIRIPITFTFYTWHNEKLDLSLVNKQQLNPVNPKTMPLVDIMGNYTGYETIIG